MTLEKGFSPRVDEIDSENEFWIDELDALIGFNFLI